jgi:hypothetical protein
VPNDPRSLMKLNVEFRNIKGTNYPLNLLSVVLLGIHQSINIVSSSSGFLIW